MECIKLIHLSLNVTFELNPLLSNSILFIYYFFINYTDLQICIFFVILVFKFKFVSLLTEILSCGFKWLYSFFNFNLKPVDLCWSWSHGRVDIIYNHFYKFLPNFFKFFSDNVLNFIFTCSSFTSVIIGTAVLRHFIFFLYIFSLQFFCTWSLGN